MPKKRVLLIEDTEDLRALEASILRQRGYDVIEAADGEEGLALALKVRPDAIVTDAMLPGRTGFDICIEVKKTPSLRNVPVLITTSIAEGAGHNDEYWRKKTGADDFMSKPFSSDTFLERVDRLLASVVNSVGTRRAGIRDRESP